MAQRTERERNLSNWSRAIHTALATQRDIIEVTELTSYNPETGAFVSHGEGVQSPYIALWLAAKYDGTVAGYTIVRATPDSENIGITHLIRWNGTNDYALAHLRDEREVWTDPGWDIPETPTVTTPVQSAKDAIRKLESIFDMIGYEECQGDNWLGTPLTQVLDYLYAAERNLYTDIDFADITIRPEQLAALKARIG